jgi:hypothetical protein
MQESNKKQFWLMVNVAMELTNHNPLSKEAILTWWHMLSKYEYQDVENALDKWVKEMSKPPTPSDILKLCQHKVTIHARLPSPLAIADNKRHAEEVKQAINTMTKKKTDHKAWARRIISGEFKSNWAGAIEFAQKALANKAVDIA